MICRIDYRFFAVSIFNCKGSNTSKLSAPGIAPLNLTFVISLKYVLEKLGNLKKSWFKIAFPYTLV